MSSIRQRPKPATVETCMTKGIHGEIVKSVKKKMPDPVALYELSDLFKLFGDSTRLGILWALSESEMCVCDLCALLKMKQPAVLEDWAGCLPIRVPAYSQTWLFSGIR